MKERFKNKYFKWGLTASIVILIMLVVFFLIFRSSAVSNAFALLSSAVAPFIYGLVMAYIFSPFYNMCVRGFKRLNNHLVKNKPTLGRALAKMMGTFLSLLLLFGIIGGLTYMVVPQLIDSVTALSTELPKFIDTVSGAIEKRFGTGAGLPSDVNRWINNFSDYFQNWVEKFVPSDHDIMTAVTSSVVNIIVIFKNFFIGVIIFAFLLNSKQKVAAQCKKIIYAAFNRKHADTILCGFSEAHHTFSGFIMGKLLDSLIVGVVTFIVFAAFSWPYAVLISVIVGVTNIIPFFGPFIGGGIGAIIMLTAGWQYALFFLILVIIIQFVDGYIMGPKILGQSTGLPTLWVIFAILLFGGLFGFIGMILGTPIFACIYKFVRFLVNGKLDKKGYATDSSLYRTRFEKNEDGDGYTLPPEKGAETPKENTPEDPRYDITIDFPSTFAYVKGQRPHNPQKDVDPAAKSDDSGNEQG